jgi:tight adherence protein C
MALFICVLLFLVLVIAITFFGYGQYVRPTRMLEQLENHSVGLMGDSESAAKRSVGKLATEFLASLGSLMPSSAEETGMKKKELAAAGFRADSAVYVIVGIQLLATVVLVVLGFLLRDHAPNPMLRLLMPAFFGAVGYMGPGIVLGRLTARRQEQLRYALADALDMLVVCSEAGCALDQAILNVSREFKMVHKALSEEFSLVNMEIVTGAARADALRNLALRTGEEELKKLVAILIQTDKFGTSIADALRTQADFMRVKRRQSAEERAGKVGVKLIFPIFFFCMPSLIVVVMGPALLDLMKNFLPSLNGAN